MGILQDAVDLLGKVEYVFGVDDIPGGKGDCSAFTEYIYGKYGLEIGGDTFAQKGKGTEVKQEALLPGDLVFFHSTFPGREGKVSHVAIYAGSHKIIHLTGGGNGVSGVVVSDLRDDYYQEHYLTARRVATSDQVGTARVPDPGETTGGTLSGGSDYDRSPAATVEGVKKGVLSALGFGTPDFSDIIVVLLIIGCVLLAVFFLFKAVAVQIKPADNVAGLMEVSIDG